MMEYTLKSGTYEVKGVGEDRGDGTSAATCQRRRTRRQLSWRTCLAVSRHDLWSGQVYECREAVQL